MNEIILSIGSNMDDPPRQIRRALELLPEYGAKIIRCSPVYRTKPWGKTDQDDFYNACAHVKTALAPYELLENIHKIENKMGRVRTIKWEPRVIDIDIILWHGLEMNDGALTIPHPLWKQRDFVLMPLADLFPDKNVWGYEFRY